ncbi:MAG: hypothetical protein ACETV0_07695 [Nitrososphaeria archaeon]
MKCVRLRGIGLDTLSLAGDLTRACLLIAVCMFALSPTPPVGAAASWQATVTGGWTPRLDGNLASFSGEWADATPVQLVSKLQTRECQVWIKHDGISLWLAWLVEDATPDTWDRVVLLVDTDHDAATSPWPDDRRLELGRAGQSSLIQGNGQSWASSLPPWESKLLDSSSSWSVEVRVPLSQLGVTMGYSGFMIGQSKTLGIGFQYFDLVTSNQTAAGTWPPTSSFGENSPSTWGRLLIQGASATTYTHTTSIIYLSTAETTESFTVTETSSETSTITLTSNRTVISSIATTTTSTQIITTTTLTAHSSTSLATETTTCTLVSTVWTTTSATSWDVPLWVFIASLSVAVAVTSLAVLRMRRVSVPSVAVA